MNPLEEEFDAIKEVENAIENLRSITASFLHSCKDGLIDSSASNTDLDNAISRFKAAKDNAERIRGEIKTGKRR
jgi:hypothetical protein